MKKIHIGTDISSELLIGNIAMQLSHEEVVTFIKKLDVICQDWGVTEELYEHFNKLHQIYLKEAVKNY